MYMSLLRKSNLISDFKIVFVFGSTKVHLHADIIPLPSSRLASLNLRHSLVLQVLSLISQRKLQFRSDELSLLVYVVIFIAIHPAHLQLRRQLPSRVVIKRVGFGRRITAGVLETCSNLIWINIVLADIFLSFLDHPDSPLIILLYFVGE